MYVWTKIQISILLSPNSILCTEMALKEGIGCAHTYIVTLELLISVLICS